MRLRAFLNGTSNEPPEEWVIGQICAAFGCLPSQAIRELDEGDADLVFTILELRGYAQAKEQVDRAKKHSDLKMTPAIKQVFEIEIEALKRRDT